MLFKNGIVVPFHNKARKSKEKNVKIISLIISKLDQSIEY